MSTFTLISLILHVMLGLLGVAYSYGYLNHLNRPTLNLPRLKRFSVTALLYYLMSWITGAYYYVTHYGTQVKGVIKAGPMPWAHGIFMEGKEHVFLFMPILAVAVAVLTIALGERIEKNPDLKKALLVLAGVIFALGVIMTFSGIFISGAYRPKL